MTLGRDEKEALQLSISAIEDTGRVMLQVRAGHPRCLVALKVLTQNESAEDERRFGLWEGGQLRLSPGERKSFWLLIDAGLLGQGLRKFLLKVVPEKREPSLIPVTLRVLDVERAPPSEARFTPQTGREGGARRDGTRPEGEGVFARAFRFLPSSPYSHADPSGKERRPPLAEDQAAR